MSLEALAAIVMGLSITFIVLVAFAVRQALPARSFHLCIPRPSMHFLFRLVRVTKVDASPPQVDTAMVMARRRTLASITQTGPVKNSPVQDAFEPVWSTVIGRLEHSFALLERGRISLATYVNDLGLIRREVLLRVDEIERSRSSRKHDPELINRQLQDASSALDAVAWCEEWARQQAEGPTDRNETKPSGNEWQGSSSLAPA